MNRLAIPAITTPISPIKHIVPKPDKSRLVVKPMMLIAANTPVVSAKATMIVSPVYSQKMEEIISPVRAVKPRYNPPPTAGETRPATALRPKIAASQTPITAR